jgi:hypothetical protein
MATPAQHIILNLPAVTAPRVADVERIAAISDPVLRNLLITQSYYELSAVFAERLTGTTNWCTFATWASKQAGQTIRGEDVKKTFYHLLSKEEDTQQALQLLSVVITQLGANETAEHIKSTALHELLDKSTARAADAVALGNKKVFEEIATQFALFYQLCYHDPVYTQENLDYFTSGLKKGLPPHGQDYLRKAFTRYYISFFEEDEKIKTELCFLANLEIGFHEQTRLQPEISTALNAAAPDNDEIKTLLYNKFFSGLGLWGQVKLFIQHLFGKTAVLDDVCSSLGNHFRRHLRRAFTDHLMTLTIAGDRLQLGKDLTVDFPEQLKELQLHDLVNLLNEIDPTPNSLWQSGATDWSHLQERMHFIADLFRCHHQTKKLFTQAFTPEQVSAIKAGRLPQGEL